MEINQMKTRQKKLLFDRDQAFSQNPGVNVAVVAAHERLEVELKKLGVEIKPVFNLEPPLGRDRNRIHNHTRLTTHDEH
ncbi:MAG: hypothetical protein OXD30_06265 [Bryobacterales bacterium]|nr:hypothetical protein [Bryobacterales bacterium]